MSVRLLAAVLAGLLAGESQAVLQVEPAGVLSPAEHAATLQLIEDSTRLLPEAFRQRLDRRVELRWQQLPEAVMARSNGRALILLNRRFLPLLLSGQAQFQPALGRHRNARQELEASVLHELLHLYDRRNWQAQPLRLSACRRQVRTLGTVGLPRHCQGQSERRFSLSDDPVLLALAAWSTDSLASKGLSERPIEPYERVNPREFVAVNFEQFMLDPQYGCRRPLLDRYWRRHFGLPAQPCTALLPYLNAGADYRQSPLAQLDPARIYQVDYLLADANANWASRFGHSMLRLVICAPERPRGPDCRLDVDQHLVLSFRAFVGDVQLSSWRGISGSYPSRLFILPLAQVVDEYTRLELRGLSSWPLKLRRAQIHRLARQAVQLHWEYSGRYYFFSNNCASETLKLLRAGSEDPRLAGIATPLPNGLLQLMQARGLVDPEPLRDADQALRLGYRFDSEHKRLLLMLQVLHGRLGLPAQSLEHWLDQPPAARQRWFAGADMRASAALLLLEQAARRRQLLQLQQQLKARYLDAEGTPTEAGRLLQRLIERSLFLSQPAQLLEHGYGIAQPEDWARLVTGSEQRRQDLLALDQQLELQLDALLSDTQRRRLAEGQDNLQQLMARLRQLHQQKNGVPSLLPAS